MDDESVTDKDAVPLPAHSPALVRSRRWISIEGYPLVPFETPSLLLLLQVSGRFILTDLRTAEHSGGNVSSWMYFVGVYRALSGVYMLIY